MSQFDTSLLDSQALPVEPVEPEAFPYDRFGAEAAAADQRYAAFWAAPAGLAVWQRVRAGEVFRDACRDRRRSLRLQLGALARSLDYATDAPMYLEPWYGIGTTAAAFGGDYVWHEGQAPAVRPLYRSLDEVPQLVPRSTGEAPILAETLATIEYFLDATAGRLPLSWCDVQAPLNTATGLVDISGFFIGLLDQPGRARELLSAITQALIDFTRRQSALIGPCLARPGHGFASSRLGTGIGLSTDNLIMVSPQLYESFCLADNRAIGAAFGGVAIHSCGDFARWLPALLQLDNLVMVDGAFSPRTDPKPNVPEKFRDTLTGTGVVLQARLVGDPDEVLALARRLWAPGLKLIVVTYVPEPEAQRRLYAELHALCQ
jgi:hypothetical protein